MTVDGSARSDASSVDRGGRAGGSHRAPRRGPNPLLLLAVLAVVVLVGAFFGVRALAGGPDPSQPQAASPSSVDTPTPASAEGGTANAGDASTGGQDSSEEQPLASDPGSVSAGAALARNERLELDDAEAAELREGQVDIRVLSLLALLSVDYTLEISDFAAPDPEAGSGLAYVVDIASVDGRRVGARAGRELVATARGQLGVYKPADVELVDGLIRITFAPRDIDELPPVPIP